MTRGLRRVGLVLLLVLIGASQAPASPSPSGHVPVYAYFYQWYTPSSWDRAKSDQPLSGKYSSDDPHVLRDQVREALAAGIDGFLTSWKSTPDLNRRLDLLVAIARDEGLDLGVVYEALDFNRQPLPVTTVRADLTYLVTRWGTALRSRRYDRPVIIWTGIDQYSTADIRSVRAALGSRAYLLAAAKNVPEYDRVASTVDGDAYYWSSADPAQSWTTAKLVSMGAVVHAHQGIWIAPAASGFDGRTLGNTRVINRDDGRTLVRSLNNAFASRPDVVGLISWNEWSENTYIEPGHRYGSQELTVLANYLRGRRGDPAPPTAVRSTGTDRAGLAWSGLRAAVLLVILTGLGGVWFSRWGSSGAGRRRCRRHVAHVPIHGRDRARSPHDAGAPNTGAPDEDPFRRSEGCGTASTEQVAPAERVSTVRQ